MTLPAPPPAGRPGRSAAGSAWVTPDTSASAARTRLAWGRTVLTATAAALLAVRPVFTDADTARVLGAAIVMAGWALFVAIAYRRFHGLSAQPPHPGRRTLAACAVLTAGFALIGGLVVTL